MMLIPPFFWSTTLKTIQFRALPPCILQNYNKHMVRNVTSLPTTTLVALANSSGLRPGKASVTCANGELPVSIVQRVARHTHTYVHIYTPPEHQNNLLSQREEIINWGNSYLTQLSPLPPCHDNIVGCCRLFVPPSAICSLQKCSADDDCIVLYLNGKYLTLLDMTWPACVYSVGGH